MHKNHKHLTDEEGLKILSTLYKKTVDEIRNVQKELHEANYCEADFLSVLINYAVKTASNAIIHLSYTGDMDRRDVMDLIVGSIVRAAGAEFVSVKVESPMPHPYTEH